MANITLSIPEELHREMKKHPEIRWSRIAREAIVEKIRDLKLLDEFANKLDLTTRETKELDEKIKSGIWKKHKELMGRD